MWHTPRAYYLLGVPACAKEKREEALRDMGMGERPMEMGQSSSDRAQAHGANACTPQEFRQIAIPMR